MSEYSLVKKIKRMLQSQKNSAVLARGAFNAFILRLTGITLLFGMHVMLARLLGYKQYGIYVYASSWINILVILSLFGFDVSLVRYIAAYRAQRKWGLLKGILRYSHQLVILLSLFISLFGVITTWFFRNQISKDHLITFYIAFILLPIFALCRLRRAILRSLKLIVQSELLLQVVRPLFLMLAVMIFYFFQFGPLKATHTIMSDLLAHVIALGVGTFLVIKALPVFFASQITYLKKEWLRVSFPLLIVAGTQLVLKHTDIIMLGAIRSSESAGIYSVASRISNLVILGLMAINTILAPMASELYHTYKKQELQQILTLSARAVFYFTLIISTLLTVLGAKILRIFGAEFVAAYIPLIILLIGQIVASLAGSVGLLMNMTGYQKQSGIIVSVCAVVNIMLNVFLIPLLGMIGAAISTAFTLALRNSIMLVYVQRKIGINPTVITRGLLQKGPTL